eukprot:3240362-Ditylum_brightwellii.AAC.1
MVGLLPKADNAWNARHGSSRLFGANYQEVNPSMWSRLFLSARYSWAFSQHLSYCMHRNEQFLMGLESDSNCLNTTSGRAGGGL